MKTKEKLEMEMEILARKKKGCATPADVKGWETFEDLSLYA